jgi:hypothetical protein
MPDKDTKDEFLLRHKSEEKIARHEYDVFLCYNEEDQHIVEAIGNQLMNRGIAPWLDKWEVRPGMSWHLQVEEQIEYIKSAAVFVGQGGTGPWLQVIIRAFLREFVERGCPVIPVHITKASGKPKLPIFLRDMQWVDFGDHDSEDDSLDRLIFGITGKRLKPRQPVHETETRRSLHVLVASLRESPIAISAMYDLLTQKEGLTLDRVVVLCPKGEDVERSYRLLRDALINECELKRIILPFEDVNSWTNAYLFLKELYTLLNTCQVGGDSIYLSLTGSDKSIEALMVSITSFFSCVKHLYHVMDSDEEHFLSINDLELDMAPLDRKSAMHPDLERLVLVDIPLESRQQIDQQSISRLLTATEDDLARMQNEAVEKFAFVQAIAEEGKILEALVTEQVMEQFRKMYQQDRDAARLVRACLERMQYTTELGNLQPDSLLYKPAMPAKSIPVELHSFTSFRTPVHPIFYTRPKDIYTALDNEVEQVVICELDSGKEMGYRSLQEIVRLPGFSIKAAYPLKKLPSVPESVLIVPLDKTSMVATQLYTLIKYQEGHYIRTVILVYPAQVTGIVEGVNLIRKALREEAKIPCTHVRVLGLKDIDSPEACQSYRAVLEKVIDEARKAHPGCIIDLALSGEQEGMIAMTTFVAQKKHVPYVYHMMSTDEKWSYDIDESMSVESLNGESGMKRNDRLFLRAYEKEGVYTKLALFKVPIFST